MPPSVAGPEKPLKPGNCIVITIIFIVRNIISFGSCFWRLCETLSGAILKRERFSVVLVVCFVLLCFSLSPCFFFFLMTSKVYYSIRIKKLVLGMLRCTPNSDNNILHFTFPWSKHVKIKWCMPGPMVSRLIHEQILLPAGCQTLCQTLGVA